jgi:hypothetical protein
LRIARSIPASALDELSDEDEDTGPTGEERDDERNITKYNVSFVTPIPNFLRSYWGFPQYSWFHVIFVLGCMYVGMLLTDWQIFSHTRNDAYEQGIAIGSSATSMWMRVISSWLCIALYAWSLIAPVLMPDR